MHFKIPKPLVVCVFLGLVGNLFADHRIVLDNEDPSGVVQAGAWSSSTSGSGFFGQSYVQDQNSGKGAKSVSFTPKITIEGNYKVYLWWPAAVSQASGVDVQVLHDGGTANLSIDQSTGGGQWVLLGEYLFNLGSEGKVILRNDGTTATVVADAALFVLVDEIVDNLDTAKISSTGTWTSSTNQSGFWGTDFVHDNDTDKGNKEFWFHPALQTPGAYDVFLRWTALNDRASNVPVDVESVTGTDSLVINQQINGESWIQLGSYDFDWDHAISIGIGTAGTSGYVIADAVRLAPSGPTGDNEDLIGFSTVGSWTTSSTGTPINGTTYLHDGNALKGQKSASFSKSDLDPGWYTIYLHWPAEAGASNKVPVTVTHAGGTSQRFANQSANAGNWVALGDWIFQTSGTVMIETTSTTGYVLADGVKWVRSYDGDLDNMADSWELEHGLDIALDDSALDPDLDGQSNLAEFENGTNPTDFFNGSTIPSITKISGDAQAGDPNTWLTNPLIVEVRDAGNALLPNVPVRFSMSGSGGLSAGNGGDIASTVTLWTDANGRANCYVFTPPGYGASRTIAAKTVAGATSPQVSFTAQSNAIPSTWFKLWLKADAGVTTDGSGNVSSWSSSGGGSFSATQATAANRPALISSGLNGLPVLRFDGSNDSLGLGNVMSGATEAELFVVLKSTAASGQNRGFLRFGSASNSGYAFYPNSTGSIQDSFGSSTYRDTGVPVQSVVSAPRSTS